MAGDHIRIEIFPNRVEMENPGRFPGLADPSKPLSISRYARNPRIVRVCSDLGIARELGEGIKRIFGEMRMLGLTDPIFSQGSGSVRLVLSSADDSPKTSGQACQRAHDEHRPNRRVGWHRSANRVTTLAGAAHTRDRGVGRTGA
jgi:predicted HTH transcriptional regulator